MMFWCQNLFVQHPPHLLGLWAVYCAGDNLQWFLTIVSLWFDCLNWLRVQNVEFAPVDLRMAMVVPPLLLSSELLGTAFVELKFHSVCHCLWIPLCFRFHQFIMHNPSSFYLKVCLFYQMDSGWHHNIYVRVHSSTGLSCMYLWCRQHVN